MKFAGASGRGSRATSQAHHAGVAMDCGLLLVVCSLGGRYRDMQG